MKTSRHAPHTSSGAISSSSGPMRCPPSERTSISLRCCGSGNRCCCRAPSSCTAPARSSRRPPAIWWNGCLASVRIDARAGSLEQDIRAPRRQQAGPGRAEAALAQGAGRRRLDPQRNARRHLRTVPVERARDFPRRGIPSRLHATNPSRRTPCGMPAGSLARPRLEDLAQRIVPCATWDDLVLPDLQKSLLRQLAAQVRYRMKVYETWGFADKGRRGLGVSALFTGASGTGKTMAAQVARRSCGSICIGIDLSAVVSKYIGETEKNLSRSSTAPNKAGLCCSSTRLMRSSASAARCATATTATPTSRSAICCSASRRTRGWRF